MIRRGIDRGDFRRVDPIVAARFMSSHHRSRIPPGAPDAHVFKLLTDITDEQVFEEISDFFFHAIRATPAAIARGVGVSHNDRERTRPFSVRERLVRVVLLLGFACVPVASRDRPRPNAARRLTLARRRSPTRREAERHRRRGPLPRRTGRRARHAASRRPAADRLGVGARERAHAQHGDVRHRLPDARQVSRRCSIRMASSRVRSTCSDARAHFSQSVFDAGALGRVQERARRRPQRATSTPTQPPSRPRRPPPTRTCAPRAPTPQLGARSRRLDARRRPAPHRARSAHGRCRRRARRHARAVAARRRFARSSSSRATIATARASSCCARSACRSTRA